MSLRAQLLCRVVDNFGDAGVCWRLARQLVREHGWQVRLTIDRPELLRRFGAREADGVRIEAWPQEVDARTADARTGDVPPGDAARPSGDPASACAGQPDDVLISAFGAEPPQSLRASLAGAPARPVWVQLEYLSAETWIGGYHGLRSTKPADGALEHYYYPGFDEVSGGLLRERDLLAQRDAFVATRLRTRWLQQHGIEADDGESLATLFCYPHAPVAEWLAAIAGGTQRWRVVVPETVADEALGTFFEAPLSPGRVLRRGPLSVQRIAFLSQDEYDRLLWSADLNLVRGEDSWIRAHWAGKPFVWQPYPQERETHRVKLQAFLARMRAGSVVESMMRAWAGDGALPPAWARFTAQLPEFAPAYRAWSTRLAGQSDLAARLVKFCAERLQ